MSSLLARKTPKQVKARWFEWLDPSIKKVEWSREEDEKLLHLAKLMPTQWRTIAPLVGRTANQCLERYQKLLDEAEQREASGLELTGPDGAETQAPSADDIRRLRPGEVDPDPESRPAKPDTVDLDEDEKEMLSEARARLANTQGKKAKRKARERQQEESRRLAALQKRRELKTAGINIKVITRKKGQMDYNADIPFEKKPVPGFYDTTEEIARNEFQRAAFDPKRSQMANKRKGDQEDDTERKKRKGEKDAPSASYQAAVKAGQMQRIREAEQSSKRRALVLPTPQVSDGELEEIVKMSMIGERANSIAQESDNDATRGLLSNYSTLNTGAPIRTPRAPPQEDHIANEIKNIRALTETTSSLLGGENTPLHEGAASTGFETVAPRRQVVATPNPLATPLRAGPNGVGATPLRPGQTPLRTPRDSFALNAADGETATTRLLQRGLAALPKPKDTDWELELPEEQAEVIPAEEQEEDAADRDRKERELREAQETLERKRRTQVMQRDLPRPASIDVESLLASASEVLDPAEALVAREVALLVANDAAKYPLPGAKPPRKSIALEQIDDAALAEARLQILMEAGSYHGSAEIQAAWTNGLVNYDDDNDDEQYQLASMRSAFDVSTPSSFPHHMTIQLLTAFQTVQDSIMEAAEKGNKLEKKLGLHLGGYKQRAEMLRKKMGGATDALTKANNALGGLRTLAISEEAAISRRLAALRDEVNFVSQRERVAQELYRTHVEELGALTAPNGYH